MLGTARQAARLIMGMMQACPGTFDVSARIRTQSCLSQGSGGDEQLGRGGEQPRYQTQPNTRSMSDHRSKFSWVAIRRQRGTLGVSIT